MLDVIKARRSVRKFTDQPVSESQIQTLLESARWAPSAGNIQPWHFFVVHSRDVRAALAEAALQQTFIAEAPVAIVVAADLDEARSSYGERGVNLYCIQDTAAATQNILLTAQWLGLGACWIGAFDEKAAVRILGLKPSVRPLAIIPVGYCAEKPSPPFRKALKQVLTVLE